MCVFGWFFWGEGGGGCCVSRCLSNQSLSQVFASQKRKTNSHGLHYIGRHYISVALETQQTTGEMEDT